MRNKKLFAKSNIILLIILLVLLATVIFISLSVREDNVQKKLSAGNSVAFIFNITSNKAILFSEVLIYHPGTHRAAVIDIPANYGSLIKSLSRVDRLDVLYKKGKPEQYIKKIEVETGLSIPFYFDFELEEFKNCVDLLGGLDFVIGTPVLRRETLSDTVLLPGGRHKLDGDKVIEYILNEELNNKDSELSSSHQKLIQTFVSALGANKDLLLMKEVFPIFYKNMDTNMGQLGLKSFLAEISNADCPRMIFHRVLGDKKTVDDKEMLFPHYNGNLLKEGLKQIVEALGNTNIIEGSNLNIAILNGTTVSGLAQRTSSTYRSLGYNVTSVGNAEESNVEATIIIGHRNDSSILERVARVIKCRNIQTENGTEGTITIILGKDFDGRQCK
ncbi:MAG: LCP family protein [Spirochaetia bacterium]|nr:LCP family protein [Spirochaetia bacterium]